MQFLGISVEDWLAVVTIVGSVCGVLIKGFKWAFHSAYKEESETNRRTFERLSDTVDTLNSTVKDLRTDLSNNNETLSDHEKRIVKLEIKNELEHEEDDDKDKEVAAND